MKVFIFISFFGILQSLGFSQHISFLKIDQLNHRLTSGNDTTFVINFWATWCAPCLKEIPNFEKLAKEYKGEKLKVLLVSVDFKSQLNASVIPFIKKNEFTSEVFLLDEQNQQEYINRIDTSWSGSIPATLFIKKNKRKFIEKEFTYPELVQQFKNIQ